MALTPTQQTVLAAAILNTPAWAAFPNDTDGNVNLAAALNLQASPVFWVWSKNVSLTEIKDAIIWANLTPADAPDGTQAWANRSLQCQGKQFNLQLLLPQAGGFGATVDASNVNFRAGLQDALTGVRSAAGGGSQTAGWSAVQQVLARRASEVEKLLSDPALGSGGTRATSATLVFAGVITDNDVQLARNVG